MKKAPARNRPRTIRITSFRGVALAALSGLLYFLAFPGVDCWPLTFVAWVPLLVAMHGAEPRRALGLAWVSGFTMTMTGFYWLLGMLRTFSGFGSALCALFMALLCAYQAGRVGLAGWLYSRSTRHGWQPELSFLLAFVASELLFPLLFPWYFGATVHGVPALTQLAELGGPIGVGLPLVCANLALAELWLARSQRRPWRRRPVLLLLAAPFLSALYAAIRIPAVDRQVAAAPVLRVGLVQANMSLFGKRHDRQEGLRRHLALTRELEREGPLDLVVWSETSVMSAVEEHSADRQLLNKFTRTLGVPALFGAVLVRPVDDPREYVFFNSAVLTDRRGRLIGRYDKHELLAFGEYLPFGDTFPILYQWSPNSGRFSQGNTLSPLPLGEHAIATFICYDDIIPSLGNRIVNNGPTGLLANLTNDAWFGDTTEPWIHLALSEFRSIEHRRFFVRSTNSGVSAFIDPVGRVVSHTDTFTEQALRADLAWLDPHTPYELWGDAPFWVLAVLSLVSGFVRRRTPSAERKSVRVAPAPTALPGVSEHPKIHSDYKMFRAKSHARLSPTKGPFRPPRRDSE